MGLTEKTKEILRRRKLRNIATGGFNSLTVGPPGCGKTSHLLHEATYFMKWYPEETIFWRDSPDSIAQFNRFPNYKVFIQDGLKVDFRNFSKGGPIKIPYKTFTDFDDLIDKDGANALAKPQTLNVVYFEEDYMWIDFLQHIRRCIGWQSVFIDEVEDIAPMNPSKREYESRNYRMEKNFLFSNHAKQLRKGLCNLLTDTQSYAEVDWRFTNKLNFVCYLRGAKVSGDSRISQYAVNNLNIGLGMIDMEGRVFGKISFKAFPPLYPQIEVHISK